MKKLSFVNLGALVLLTAGAALAQSNSRLLAEIPFGFRAGNQVFPAGHYEVRPQVAPGIVLIKCVDCDATAMIGTHSLTSVSIPEQGKLVFNRYGNSYFLSKILVPGYATGREFRKSKAELEWARNEKPSLVTVATR